MQNKSILPIRNGYPLTEEEFFKKIDDSLSELSTKTDKLTRFYKFILLDFETLMAYSKDDDTYSKSRITLVSVLLELNLLSDVDPFPCKALEYFNISTTKAVELLNKTDREFIKTLHELGVYIHEFSEECKKLLKEE
ncbi:MAG: hypothetical protein IJC02_01940 [Lachnospiraceae bacterium]|nr:hypothetical protein [Lachnospiraceae bacterium]